jgi:endogenous inhibitor of DNA gyrase (YacG/DUF329 family)
MTTTAECPGCGEAIPEENDETGEGPVYWTVDNTAFCGMECVVKRHRAWLKENKEQNRKVGARG